MTPKKIICVAIAILTVLSTCAGCTRSSSKTSDSGNSAGSYLVKNADGQWVVEKGKNVTLNAVVFRNSAQCDSKDSWGWKYLQDYYNVNIKVEQVTDTTEYKNLTFASGKIPDIMVNMSVSPSDIVKYGIGEKMFLPIDKYAKYMPNLSAIYNKDPVYKKSIAAPDGHLYGLGQISDPKDVSRQINVLLYHKAWCDKLGLSMPGTVDEFINMLRAFKKDNKNCVPFDGYYNATNPGLILMTAYGWTTRDPKGLSVCLRNGKVTFPYGDRDAYGAYLKAMNTIYSEGLMPHDFYTAKDATALTADIAKNLSGVVATDVITATKKDSGIYMEWDSMSPLKSDLNNTRIWPVGDSATTCDKWTISSQCKYPELACAIADQWFSPKGMITMSYGPMVGSGLNTYGVTTGWKWNTSTNWLSYDGLVNDTAGKYGASEWNYRMATTCIFTSVGFGDIRDFMGKAAEIAGYKYDRKSSWTPDSYDMRIYYTASKNQEPYYTTEMYPGVVFFDDTTASRVADLATVINAYVQTETAKFVTGARSLTESELNAYFKGLDAIGYQEYLKYYADYFKKVKG